MEREAWTEKARARKWQGGIPIFMLCIMACLSNPFELHALLQPAHALLHSWLQTCSNSSWQTAQRELYVPIAIAV